MIAGALICGFLARRSRVSIGYAPFLGQLITMVVRSGGIDAAPGSDIFRIYRTERSGGGGLSGFSGQRRVWVGGDSGGQNWTWGDPEEGQREAADPFPPPRPKAEH